MIRLKCDKLTKSILRKLIKDDFLTGHITEIGDNCTQTFFDGKEVYKLLETIKKDDRNATARVLSEIYNCSSEEIKNITTMLYTVTARDILFHYYLKETISEDEILLLTEYENIASTTPTIQAELEEIQKIIVEMKVTEIEHIINEHTIRLFKNDIFDVLEKKLQLEDVYAEEDGSTSKTKYMRIWDYKYIYG